VRGLIDERRPHEARLDALAAGTPLARHERRHRPERSERTRAVVVVGNHVEHGLALPALCDHEARARLEDRVEAGKPVEAALRAADRGRHERGVDRAQAIPAEPEALHHAGTEVLDDDIRVADQLLERRAPVGVLQVEHERAFAAVPAVEAVGSHAKRVAVGRLDLDDVGAEVAEQHRTDRAGDEAREIEDANAFQTRLRRRRRARVPRVTVGDACSGGRLPLVTDESRGTQLGIAEILVARLHRAARDVRFA
jgi:hypothetical protein